MGALSHPRFGAVPSRVSRVLTNPSNNDVSTSDTVQQMILVAKQSATHPVVVAAVQQATLGLHGDVRDYQVVEAIFNWIKGNVKFVQDEEVLEEVFGLSGEQADLIIAPERLLTMPVPAGDCDCISTLLASMLLASGKNFGIEFTTIAADEDEPSRFSHVYVIVELCDGTRIPLDASHGKYVGWEADNIFRRKNYGIKGKQGCRKGLGMLSGVWTDVLQQGVSKGIDTTTAILSARYGVPPAGTAISVSPSGSQIVRQQNVPGFSVGAFPPMSFSSGGGDILKWGLIIGAVVLGIKVIGK